MTRADIVTITNGVYRPMIAVLKKIQTAAGIKIKIVKPVATSTLIAAEGIVITTKQVPVLPALAASIVHNGVGGEASFSPCA